MAKDDITFTALKGAVRVQALSEAGLAWLREHWPMSSYGCWCCFYIDDIPKVLDMASEANLIVGLSLRLEQEEVA